MSVFLVLFFLGKENGKGDGLVIVDVELRGWVGGPGVLKGVFDKVVAEELVEDTVAEGSVLLEDLVDHILNAKEY
jgi:hypothetical protein